MMNRQEKMEMCMTFFRALELALSETHEVVGSCNNNASFYLVPKGTEEQISYYGKPKKSFRISDHWNWYSNLTKCDIPGYAQCYSADMPWPRRRPEEGRGSSPIIGIAVQVFGADNRYHTVYGEKFDRKTRNWAWMEGSIENAIEMMGQC